MTDAEKAAAQATADAKAAEEKAAADKAAEAAKAKPTGLDGMTPEALQALYKQSPEMFKGIVPEAKKVEEVKPPVSAAPKYGDTELKIPEGVPFQKEVLATYLEHAKEVGLTPQQVQKQIDFQVKLYNQQNPPKTDPKAEDAANVATLKAEFGTEYDKNIEIARQAAAKFGDPALLEKLKTSDPVLIKHFLKIGKADADDVTPQGGKPRTGNEADDEEKQKQDQMKQRYNHPNSRTMFRE